MSDNYCECSHMEENHNWEWAEYGPGRDAPCLFCECSRYRFSHAKPWQAAVTPSEKEGKE